MRKSASSFGSDAGSKPTDRWLSASACPAAVAEIGIESMACEACAHFGRALIDDIARGVVTLEPAGGICVAPTKRPHARRDAPCQEEERDGRSSDGGSD